MHSTCIQHAFNNMHGSRLHPFIPLYLVFSITFTCSLVSLFWKDSSVLTYIILAVRLSKEPNTCKRTKARQYAHHAQSMATGNRTHTVCLMEVSQHLSQRQPARPWCSHFRTSVCPSCVCLVWKGLRTSQRNCPVKYQSVNCRSAVACVY